MTEKRPNWCRLVTWQWQHYEWGTGGLHSNNTNSYYIEHTFTCSQIITQKKYLCLHDSFFFWCWFVSRLLKCSKLLRKYFQNQAFIYKLYTVSLTIIFCWCCFCRSFCRTLKLGWILLRYMWLVSLSSFRQRIQSPKCIPSNSLSLFPTFSAELDLRCEWTSPSLSLSFLTRYCAWRGLWPRHCVECVWGV